MNLPPVFGKRLREVVHDNVSLPRLFMAFRSPFSEVKSITRPA